MYPRMAQEAREEGFADLAIMFEGIAAIGSPGALPGASRKPIKEGSVFKKDLKVSGNAD